MPGAESLEHVAFVGLGANLGDRHSTITAALDRLDSKQDIRITSVSSMHETAPMGGPSGQPMFLNGVVRLVTDLEPGALLGRLLDIERGLGRERREHWGPRTIDLDLLMYDDLVLNLPGLTLPHPRMHERRFVLVPLMEIAADLRHPILKRTVAELLGNLSI